MDRDYYFGPRQSDRRKRSNGKRRVFAVNEMTELHHEIARRILLGQKNVDIAEDLNCVPQTVSNVRNSPVVQSKLGEMVKKRDERAVNIIEEVNRRLPRALEILDEVLYDETGELPLSMRVKEANTLLDRKEKIEGLGQRHFHAHAMLSDEDLENIKRRALEAGMRSGVVAGAQRAQVSDPNVIDVESEEIKDVTD